MHKAPKSEMLIIDNQGKVSLTIRGPWHARWEKGTAVATGIGSGVIGYSVTSAAQREDKLHVAIEASAASLASLQFLQTRMREIGRVAINQMLLHPFVRFSVEAPAT
ncbi:hypothetical protein AAY473_039247 [Plecturocebus cupreus]